MLVDLITTVLLVLSVTILVSFVLTTVFDFSTNSLLEVDELKTGDLSEDSLLTGVSLGTQLHEPYWNLSSLLHLAAILLLILLPQNDPVDDGPEFPRGESESEGLRGESESEGLRGESESSESFEGL